MIFGVDLRKGLMSSIIELVNIPRCSLRYADLQGAIKGGW